MKNLKTMVSRFGKSRKISKPYCAKRAKILRNDPRFIDFSAAGENFEVFLLKFDDFPLKFIKLRAAGAKKMKISKPYFQLSMKFEKSQNPFFNFPKILKNLKTPMPDLEFGFSKSQKLELRGGG